MRRELTEAEVVKRRLNEYRRALRYAVAPDYRQPMTPLKRRGSKEGEKDA